jgi:hypothetical protein
MNFGADTAMHLKVSRGGPGEILRALARAFHAAWLCPYIRRIRRNVALGSLEAVIALGMPSSGPASGQLELHNPDGQ